MIAVTVPALCDFNRVGAVAAYLTVSRRCIYRLVELGAIASVRIGTGRGDIRIRRVDVEAYLAANTHAAGVSP